MPSKLKSQTARANGAKSKGPATPQGKTASSRNALKHGLSSEVVVLPHEDRAAFERLRESYLDRFEPADQPEADLVETMAAARWRLNRLIGIEAKLFEKEMALRSEDWSKHFDEIDEEGKLACVFDRCANEGKSLALLVRYEGQLNRTYDRALKQLQGLQKSRIPAPPPEIQNEPKPDPAHQDNAPLLPAEPIAEPSHDAPPAPTASDASSNEPQFPHAPSHPSPRLS